MRCTARSMIFGAALLVPLALASVESRSTAEDGEIRGDILKLADAIQRGDGGAKSHAEVIAKKAELEDVMGLFRLRTKKGFGVGDKPGAIKPDGIEAQIMNLGKRELRKEQLAAESSDLARAAYIAAAIAEIAEAKCPVDRKQGEKDPKSWRKWAEDMNKSALELAKAAHAHKSREVKTAANKLNSSCNACHAVFRE